MAKHIVQLLVTVAQPTGRTRDEVRNEVLRALWGTSLAADGERVAVELVGGH